MPRSGTVAAHLGGATQARSRERRRGKRKSRLRAGDPLKRYERTETGLPQIPSPVIIEEMGSDLIFYQFGPEHGGARGLPPLLWPVRAGE